MAFTFQQYDKGQTAPHEYLPGKAGETIVVGEALVVAAGVLTKCGPTARPTYIAAGPANVYGVVPVTRVQADIVYAAPLTADGSGLTIGQKVTIAADGLGVTATTTSGVAEIVSIDGTAVGDTVTVRF